MYKTMNTGTGKGMLGTREIGGMLYSGECPKTFLGMSPNIPGDVLKHSGECREKFRGMWPNIPGNKIPRNGRNKLAFNSMVGRLSMGRSFIKFFVVCCRFYIGLKKY